MTLIHAAAITPMEKMSALQILAAVGYDPTTPKVKRAAEYLELWREKSLEAGKDDISLCPICNCMTHTVDGKCGKCGGDKS